MKYKILIFVLLVSCLVGMCSCGISGSPETSSVPETSSETVTEKDINKEVTTTPDTTSSGYFSEDKIHTVVLVRSSGREVLSYKKAKTVTDIMSRAKRLACDTSSPTSSMYFEIDGVNYYYFSGEDGGEFCDPTGEMFLISAEDQSLLYDTVVAPVPSGGDLERESDPGSSRITTQIIPNQDVVLPLG